MEKKIGEQEDITDDFDESDATLVLPWDESERLLEKYVDEVKGQAYDQDASGAADTCDLCGRSFNDRKYLIDGRMRVDLIWACMCSNCFLQRGAGIGWGQGQLFARRLDGEWLLV